MYHKNKLKPYIHSLLVLSFFPAMTFADAFTHIRIGDNDGFGYAQATGFIGADGDAANRGNTALVLMPTDVLPDLNQDGRLNTYDVFDNREENELLNLALEGQGFYDAAKTTGITYTDISLSTKYESYSANDNVYSALTNNYSAGGIFPDATGDARPNSPTFLFDFKVNAIDIVQGEDLYFNMIFADYDVYPASVELSFISAQTRTVTLQTQNNKSGQDGLIQSAYVVVEYDDLFNDIGNGVLHGSLGVNFKADNEPYIAFDFVEIGTTTLPNPIIYVAEPSTCMMFLMGVIGMLRIRRVSK